MVAFEDITHVRERETLCIVRPMAFTHSIEETILMGDRVAVLSSRPGRVKEIVEIPFGHPRGIEDVFRDARFGELRNRVWDELRAMATADLTHTVEHGG